ncbi:MAG: YdeI/OmpD-associated family protein [Actinomycetota bacterium]|nr:YdeI/OmpD-associated family protein [Actinomycetota bacterium]
MEFTAKLRLDGKTATGIAVPPEVVESLGAGKRVPVVVTIGGHAFRTTIAPYNGQYVIPVSADNRAAAGVAAGDELSIGLEVDTAPRVVEVPDDLEAALASSPAAAQFFASLSFSNQRGYVSWVEEAKKVETRDARVAKSISSLEAGQKVH